MITLDLIKIRSAKEAMSQAKDAANKAKEALRPVLEDVNLMGEVLRHFIQFLTTRSEVMNADKRKQFLFIIVYLFCPSSLLGDAMPRGFRERLRVLLQVEAPTVISNDIADLLFLYNHYKDFRAGVNDAYSYIAEEMHIESNDGWWTESK